MSTVIGAIDASAAAGPVLAATKAVAHLLRATPRAFHVRENGVTAVCAAAAAAGIELELETAPVADALGRAGHRPDVAALVLGARGMPGGPSPAGHAALELVTSSDTPLVVVPPVLNGDRMRRVLVALDGTPESSAAITRTLQAARDRAVEIVLLHVHEPAALPPFDDHPPHELEAWTHEFIARWCPGGRDARLEVRVGEPARRIVEVAQECKADLIVLSWSRSLAGGHGSVVREALERSEVPVLLVPIAASADDHPRKSAAELHR